MKMIVAVIRPEKLDAVITALDERDVHLMTVSDVRGCGRQRGYTETYRGAEYKTRLLPKLKLESAVNEHVSSRRDDRGDHEGGPDRNDRTNRRRKNLRPIARRLRANSHRRARNGRHRPVM